VAVVAVVAVVVAAPLGGTAWLGMRASLQARAPTATEATSRSRGSV
jgi:hypothetical protein